MNETTLRQCPYVGLVPYGEEDWEYFFGRETETDLIVANLTAARLTLLYGASGVGKSSVLRAGVAHRLRDQARRNRERSVPPEFALAIFSGWRDDPLAGLARELCDAVGVALGRDMGPPPDRGSLAEACPRWAEEVGGDLFVVLDQFEEYFLYHGREDGEGSFAVEFPRLVNREGLRVNFLVAIRDDAVARLDRFKGRIPRLFDNYLRLHHLDLEAAARAIRDPLARYNERHAREAVVIEDDAGAGSAASDAYRSATARDVAHCRTGPCGSGRADRSAVPPDRHDATVGRGTRERVARAAAPDVRGQAGRRRSDRAHAPRSRDGRARPRGAGRRRRRIPLPRHAHGQQDRAVGGRSCGLCGIASGHPRHRARKALCGRDAHPAPAADAGPPGRRALRDLPRRPRPGHHCVAKTTRVHRGTAGAAAAGRGTQARGAQGHRGSARARTGTLCGTQFQAHRRSIGDRARCRGGRVLGAAGSR